MKSYFGMSSASELRTAPPEKRRKSHGPQSCGQLHRGHRTYRTGTGQLGYRSRTEV